MDRVIILFSALNKLIVILQAVYKHACLILNRFSVKAVLKNSEHLLKL